MDLYISSAEQKVNNKSGKNLNFFAELQQPLLKTLFSVLVLCAASRNVWEFAEGVNT